MKKFNKSLFSIVTILIYFFVSFPVKIVQFLSLTTLFIIFLSFIYSILLKRSIIVERKITKLKIACKEKVQIMITVKNSSYLKANVFYIMDNVPFLQVQKNQNSEIVTLKAKEVLNYSYFVTAMERGIYTTGPIKVRASDPIGLFPFELEIDNILEITVRPARIKLITQSHPGLPQGSIKINNMAYEDITQRKSVRNYMSGDEQRRINWRISAKQNDLFINQYENTYDTTFFVFLNLAEDDYELSSRYYEIEKAVEIAASIVEKAREMNQRVGFAAYGTNFPYLAPANNQYDIILDILSTIKIEKGKLEYNPVQYYKNQLPNETAFYLVGPEQVRNYFAKVEANMENITSDNIYSYRKENVRK